MLSEVQYGNGGKIRYGYDEYDRLVGISDDGDDPLDSPTVEYSYGANGKVAEEHDHRYAQKRVFAYDMSERLCQEKEISEFGPTAYQVNYGYDKYGNLVRLSERIFGSPSPYITNYTYDNDNRPTAIQYGADTRKVEYTYDELGRIASKSTRNGNLTRGTTYNYVAGNPALTNATTPLVSSISQYGMDFSYTYDNVGNILSETREGVTTTYAYDSLGQLIRVNDPHDTTSGSAGTTWVYNYDLGGNITSKMRYAYTTGTLGTALETIPYSYTDSNWKDKLTAYNGQSITYDAIGNPLNDGTWTYSWQAGRRLAQMSKSGTTVQYQYDANGLRVSKIVNGTETTYALHGKLLMHLKQGANEMHFYYDAQSRPAMVNFNGAYYTYLHNLQGDVVGLVDSSNNLVVEYKYDAWGRPTLKRSLTIAYDTLATLNPFRYRGYVYDEETGLYYLRSRYYNPVWGRPVNADIIIGYIAGVCSHNIFTYCHNQPVLFTDESGHIPTVAAAVAKAAQVAKKVMESILTAYIFSMVNAITQQKVTRDGGKLVSFDVSKKSITTKEADSHNSTIENVVKFADRAIALMLISVEDPLSKLTGIASMITGWVKEDIISSVHDVYIDAFTVMPGEYVSISAVFQYSHKHAIFIECDADYISYEIRLYGSGYMEVWRSTYGCFINTPYIKLAGITKSEWNQ